MNILLALAYADTSGIDSDPYPIAVWVCDNFGVFITLVTLTVTAIITFMRFSDKLTKIDSDFKSTSKTLGALVNAFNCLITELRSDDIIKETSALSMSSSPQKLTDFGKKVLADSGFQSFVDSNKSELFSKITATKPPTNFDIELNSMNLLMSYLGDPRMNGVKEYAFQNAKIPILSIINAGGIYLRDLYIEEVKNKSV